MARVGIVTDSAAALDSETIERLQIKIIPISIHLGTETFREGIDISSEQFLARLGQTGGYPSASPPTIADFHAAYEELSKTCSNILSLHVSGAIDGTTNMARRAAESFLGRCSIDVMDSETISFGQGIIVRAAAEAAQGGEGIDDIVRLIRGMIPHIYSIYFVERLDYLERGGRIGVAQAILGTMLDIKPILTIEDGQIIPMEKVRTREKAIEKLFEFVAEFSNVEELVVLRNLSSHDIPDLLERLDTIVPQREISTYVYNPSLAVRLGPTAMGAVIYEGLY